MRPSRAQHPSATTSLVVRDEAAAGSNPVTPTSVSAGQRPAPEMVRASLAASTAANTASTATNPRIDLRIEGASPSPRCASRTAGVAVGARRDRASVTAGDIDTAGQFVLGQAHMETGVTQGDWVDTGFHSHVRTLRDRPWSHAGSATNRATAPRSSRGIIPSKSLSEVVVEDRRDEGRGAGDETGVGVRRRGLSRQNQSRSDRQSQFLVFTLARLGRLGDRWRVAGRSRRRTACVTSR